MTKFIEGSTFEGVWFPKFDSNPNGPKIQSMVLCKCGEWWKNHRFVDGACPVKEKEELK